MWCLRARNGRFLAKVYATVAILHGRLPPEWQQERDLLLRMCLVGRICKELLDAMQDFLCPIHLTLEPVDLAVLTTELVRDAQDRWPALEMHAEGTGPAIVLGDFERIAHVGKMLLTNACEAAHRRVALRTVSVPETRIVEWTIRDDGPGVTSEHKMLLFTPFFSTRPGHGGLGWQLRGNSSSFTTARSPPRATWPKADFRQWCTSLRSRICRGRKRQR